jgi:hypothetical protein
MKLFIIGLCVSFFPIQAIAEGQTGWHQIEWLFQRECKDNRGLEVRLQTAHDNPDLCSNEFVLEVKCKSKSRQPFASQSALLNTTFTEDYFVQAFVNGCDEEGHAKVSAVEVSKDEP